jgi:arylsulfatase
VTASRFLPTLRIHRRIGLCRFRKTISTSTQVATTTATTCYASVWNDLSDEEKRIEAREMELYASLLHHFDDQIERLLDYLKSANLYDNTLIVFMSDNGAAADDFYNRGGYSEYLQAHYDNSYENMGKPGSFVSYGLPWAEAGSAPFSRHKGYTRQGGIAASMIIAGRSVDRSGVINDSYLTVMDLAPTFLELAGADYPSDAGLSPMLGESMADLLAGNTHAAHDDDYTTVLYYEGRAFVRQDDWKLVNWEPPFDESTFELYNLGDDPGETTNLRESEPERYAQMVELWHARRQALGILLPEGQ